jgi:hypothetical protein
MLRPGITIATSPAAFPQSRCHWRSSTAQHGNCSRGQSQPPRPNCAAKISPVPNWAGASDKMMFFEHMSGAGQERPIGHVGGMSAEPSTTEVGVPVGGLASSNGPHSPARAAGARHRRGAATGRRVVDLTAQTLSPLRADTPRIPSGRSLRRQIVGPAANAPARGGRSGAENAFE